MHAVYQNSCEELLTITLSICCEYEHSVTFIKRNWLHQNSKSGNFDTRSFFFSSFSIFEKGKHQREKVTELHCWMMNKRRNAQRKNYKENLTSFANPIIYSIRVPHIFSTSLPRVLLNHCLCIMDFGPRKLYYPSSTIHQDAMIEPDTNHSIGHRPRKLVCPISESEPPRSIPTPMQIWHYRSDISWK